MLSSSKSLNTFSISSRLSRSPWWKGEIRETERETKRVIHWWDQRNHRACVIHDTYVPSFTLSWNRSLLIVRSLPFLASSSLQIPRVSLLDWDPYPTHQRCAWSPPSSIQNRERALKAKEKRNRTKLRSETNQTQNMHINRSIPLETRHDGIALLRGN